MEEVNEYIDKFRSIQEAILNYIDKENDVEEMWTNFTSLINEYQIKKDCHEVETMLHLVNKICKNHCHSNNFYNKIEQIILIFANEIKKYFLNKKIFNFFKTNKKIILFLKEQELITFDKYILQYIMQYRCKKYNYPNYFFNEIKDFIDEKEKEEILEENNKYDGDFEAKRKIGENDDYICQLIRNDDIDKFISYVNQNDISVNSTIKNSIFESNRFLLKQKSIELIEYSTFFGANQIFKYLSRNGAMLTSSLWLYSIHSCDQEIIDFLYEKKNYIDLNYDLESIKCHHNDTLNYINSLQYENKIPQKNIDYFSYRYYNFFYFDIKTLDQIDFFLACQFFHNILVIILIKYKVMDLNNTYI